MHYYLLLVLSVVETALRAEGLLKDLNISNLLKRQVKMGLLGLIFLIFCLSRKSNDVLADKGVCSPGDDSCVDTHDNQWHTYKIDDKSEYEEDSPSEEEGGEEEEEEEGETCFDVADDCESRAMNDGCILNFATMSEECEMTCQLCVRDYNLRRVPNLYSLAPQFLHNDESLGEYVTQVDEYVYETIYRGDHPDNVKLNCKNSDPQCSFWAHGGECELNPEIMAERCPAACMDCESGLSYATRCPSFDTKEPGIWQPGDLNAMFMHLVNSLDDAAYSPVVVSRPMAYPNPKFNEKDGPWIVLLDEFLSEEETEALLKLVEEADYEDVTDESQSFDVHYCEGECSESKIVTEVENRLEYLTGIPAKHNEVFTFFKHGEDSFHAMHSDYDPAELSFAQGPRILTVTIFLNDLPQQEDDVDEENPNGGLYFESTESVSTKVRAEALLPRFVFNVNLTLWF